MRGEAVRVAHAAARNQGDGDRVLGHPTTRGGLIERQARSLGGELGVQIGVQRAQETVYSRVLQRRHRRGRVERNVIRRPIHGDNGVEVEVKARHRRDDLMARTGHAPGRGLAAEAGGGAGRQGAGIVGDGQPVGTQARIEHGRGGVDAGMRASAVAGREDDQDVIVENRLVEVAVVAARTEGLTHQRLGRVEGQAVRRTPAVVDDPHLAGGGQVDDVGLGRADDVAVDVDVAEPQEVAGGEVGRGRIDVGAEGVAEHQLAFHAAAADGARHVGAVTFPAAPRIDAAVVAVVVGDDGVQALDLARPAEQRVVHVDARVIYADGQALAGQAQGIGVLQT